MMASRPGGHAAGMTLPELLIVIAIVGIIAVVAIPNFNTFWRSYKASTAIDEMISDMRLARQLAVTRREIHTMAPLADPANSWTLTNTVTSTVERDGDMPEGVTISVAPTAFSFNPNGACTNPTTYAGTTPNGQFVQVDAVISASRTDRYTIEISPVGRAKTTRVSLP